MNGDLPISQPRPLPLPQEYYNYNRNSPRSRKRDEHEHPQPFVSYDDPHENDHHSAEGAESGDDSDDALSFQTLNADGTPKRPMNAFLLYAKKRRPQISTNHPTMRTGEISKVLSKEWQTMNKGEKQYYQDKAKKLKDNFNIRWPDYVYKRRPNNSRKKRRGNPSADSPVIEEPPSRRASVGAENAYGDESGAEDAEGSPNLIVRLPHERHHHDDSTHRLPPAYGAATSPSDPRPPPPSARPSGLSDPGSTMGPRLGTYSSSNPPGPYPYDEPYSSYPYYTSGPSTQGPPRLPPVWNSHEPNRAPYEGPRSSSGTSAGYSPVNEDSQSWPTTARSGANALNNPPWPNILNSSNSNTGPMSSARAIPRTTSSEHSPVQSATELAYSGNRPRNWPPTPVSESGGRPQFQTLNAPLYPPGNNSRSHPQRGTSPPPYYGGGSGGSSSGNGYGYNTQGSTSGVSSLGRSPMLPAIAALDHSHQHSSHTFPPAQQQQPSSHLRDTGYSPLLPPIAPGSSGAHSPPSEATSRPYSTPPFSREESIQDQHRTGTQIHRHVPMASHPYSESRSSSSGSGSAPQHTLHRQPSSQLQHLHEAERPRGSDAGSRDTERTGISDNNTLPLPIGINARPPPTEFSASTHHQSYWDPVKSEAGD